MCVCVLEVGGGGAGGGGTHEVSEHSGGVELKRVVERESQVAHEREGQGAAPQLHVRHAARECPQQAAAGEQEEVVGEGGSGSHVEVHPAAFGYSRPVTGRGRAVRQHGGHLLERVYILRPLEMDGLGIQGSTSSEHLAHQAPTPAAAASNTKLNDQRWRASP